MTNTSGASLTAPKVLKWLGCDKWARTEPTLPQRSEPSASSFYKSSHCDRNNIMQASATTRSLGKQLTHLMWNRDGQIAWFLTYKSLNFRGLSTPSRAGGFFFNPFNRLAFLPNSRTSMVSNTWTSGEQRHYRSICREKRWNLLN